MTIYARDIMVKTFDTIFEEAPVEEAVEKILNGRVRENGHKTVSLMVVDGYRKLAGVISMFDLLYHLRPAFLNFGIDGDELTWHGQLEKFIGELKGKTVKQVMSENVVGASEDEHLMVVLDRMVKRKYRRLPVLEGDKPIGVIYISDIYHKLFSHR